MVVPAGFMPGPVSDGWFIQLCPQGLSPAAMELLHPGHGQDHRAHVSHDDHHARHGGQSDDGKPHDDSTSGSNYCPLGSLYSAAAVPQSVEQGPMLAVTADRPEGETLTAIVYRRTGYQARAPPRS
jgi:hypothetical protein